MAHSKLAIFRPHPLVLIASLWMLLCLTMIGLFCVARIEVRGSCLVVRVERAEPYGLYSQFSDSFLGFRYMWSNEIIAVAIPYWFLGLVLAVTATWWFITHRRRPRRRDLGLCPACGYDLRATPDRCPECGTPALTETAISNR